MPKPNDPALYNEAKDYIYSRYKKNSAFRSGAVVKYYKQLFVEKHNDSTPPYSSDGGKKNLKRWFQEKWININPVLGITDDSAYPVFRPTLKVNDKTPTLMQDISKSELKNKIEQKQLYRGKKNLSTFIPKSQEKKD